MSRRITIRACAAPLLPQHLVAALARIEGMGFGADETQSFGSDYHRTALEACGDAITSDKAFAKAIEGRVYKPIGRPISQLNAANQFLAMAPSLEICDLTPKTEAMLEALMNGPFVITFRTFGTLDRARRSDDDPETSRSKLAGFVEHHLGCAAALFHERPNPLGIAFSREKA